jgi:hypothetical protein
MKMANSMRASLFIVTALGIFGHLVARFNGWPIKTHSFDALFQIDPVPAGRARDTCGPRAQRVAPRIVRTPRISQIVRAPRVAPEYPFPWRAGASLSRAPRAEVGLPKRSAARWNLSEDVDGIWGGNLLWQAVDAPEGKVGMSPLDTSPAVSTPAGTTAYCATIRQYTKSSDPLLMERR